jgi:hypothetical protein
LHRFSINETKIRRTWAREKLTKQRREREECEEEEQEEEEEEEEEEGNKTGGEGLLYQRWKG